MNELKENGHLVWGKTLDLVTNVAVYKSDAGSQHAAQSFKWSTT